MIFRRASSAATSFELTFMVSTPSTSPASKDAA